MSKVRPLRTPAALLLVALVVAMAAPAAAKTASEARREREDARRKRAEAAAQLDALEVSDRQLEAAVADLAADVEAQSAKVASARQAAVDADRAVATAQARVEAGRRRVGTLRLQVQERAVAAYIRPGGSSVGELLSSADLGEASRKQALLTHVARNEFAVLDELQAAEEDLTVVREEAEAAAGRARAHRRDAEARLAGLEQARADKERVERELDLRIEHIRSESAALARQEEALSGFIRQKEEEARRRAEAAARQARAGAGGSSGASDAAAPSAGSRPSSASGLIWPTRGPVTSEFGQRWGRLHAGIDIGAGIGTPIWAAKAGTVIFSGSMNGYGNVVIVDHSGGFTTVYAHQSRRAVSEGMRVSRGAVLGYVGSTGHSTGPHLHFETRVSGSPQNPRRYLP